MTLYAHTTKAIRNGADADRIYAVTETGDAWKCILNDDGSVRHPFWGVVQPADFATTDFCISGEEAARLARNTEYAYTEDGGYLLHPVWGSKLTPQEVETRTFCVPAPTACFKLDSYYEPITL